MDPEPRSSSQVAGVPQAPPICSGTPAYVAPFVWPTVLGVIALVIGGGGVLKDLWGAVSGLLFTDFALDWSARFSPPGFEEVTGAIRPWYHRMGMAAAASVPISGILLVAGFGLLWRRRWALPVTMTWAALRIVGVLVLAALTYFMQQAQFKAMANSKAGGAAMMGAVSPIIGIASVVIVLAWGWALPVFMVAWFARSKIRGQVNQWQTGGRAR